LLVAPGARPVVLQFAFVPPTRHPRATRGKRHRSRASSRELRILKTIAEALNGAGGVDQALQTTLEQVAALLGLHTGWIWLADPQTGRFYSAVARRLPPFLREPVRMTGHRCWCLDAFRAGELTAGNIDVMECSRLRAAVAATDRARTHGLRFHASIPFYFGDRPLGIMNVAGPAWRKLTRRELDLLSTIASQVGVAIERARLAGESVHMARIEERTHLARQLHDTLAQRLTAIGLHIETALDATRNKAVTDQLQRALELSRAGLDEARGSIRELRGSARQPLDDALAALAHAFSGETGIRVHVGFSGHVALTPAEEDEVVRIASEALTNVRKHAHATEVELSLRARPDRLEVQIADNGRGFNARSRSTGFGLVGMRERAQMLGGRMRITSRPQHGTRLVLTVPRRAATA
jgi:two-component system NarL family sensor kinase